MVLAFNKWRIHHMYNIRDFIFYSRTCSFTILWIANRNKWIGARICHHKSVSWMRNWVRKLFSGPGNLENLFHLQFCQLWAVWTQASFLKSFCCYTQWSYSLVPASLPGMNIGTGLTNMTGMNTMGSTVGMTNMGSLSGMGGVNSMGNVGSGDALSQAYSGIQQFHGKLVKTHQIYVGFPVYII